MSRPLLAALAFLLGAVVVAALAVWAETNPVPALLAVWVTALNLADRSTRGARRERP